MSTRNFLLSVFSFGVGACLLLPASAAELPKEGTCHVKSKADGKQTVDSLSAKVDGISSWDETYEIISVDCGQAQLPPRKTHCFGLDELDGKFAASTGYCIDTDQDNDKIIWEIAPSKEPQYALTLSSSTDVLMASGKYTGMSGKSTSDCTHGGSLSSYVGHCDVERTFKFP